MANNKQEISFWKMVISLALVTLISSATLGVVYEVTKEPIAAAKLAKQIRAISQVVPSYDNQPVDDMFKIAVDDQKEDSLEVFPAKKDGETVGWAIKSYSPKGYSGMIWVMVGLNTDFEIFNTYVLEHKETPGLGSKMTEPEFNNQFQEVDPSVFNLKVEKDGGDIDALTGATITSRAFGDALQRAFNSAEMNIKTHEPAQ
ncbi:MAG TPA: RnfABCDGE type electron transport complex subunit G [Cytophagales bacterium]|mgnify:FL=1|jgi:electron transport complex protein RnfG|nr:RnfABCDGE type electron transport complex subunit G [Cytophagales bacterium]